MTIPLDPLFRLNVGLVIINQEKKVFIGKRINLANALDDVKAWQMPQGGINYEEDPYLAALREMKEEIGTDHVRLLAESKGWLSYHFPDDLANKLWGGRFVGQKQKWFLFALEGGDDQINLATKHPEFCEWKWETPDKILDLIIDFKKEVYEDVFKEFASYLI